MVLTEGITGFRLLGVCPNCNTEDTIWGTNERFSTGPVKCIQCAHSWSDWYSLVHPDTRSSGGLIPVLIDRPTDYWSFELRRTLELGAQVKLPEKRNIPHADLVIALVLFIFFISVWMKRLHDIDRTGWWLLLMLAPLINIMFFVYLWFTPGTRGKNKHGPVPNSLTI